MIRSLITASALASALAACAAAPTATATEAATETAVLAQPPLAEPPVAASSNAAAYAPEAPQAATPAFVSASAAAPHEQASRRAQFDAAMARAADRQRVFASAEPAPEDAPAPPVTLEGDFVQGGLVFGAVAPGAEIRLDGDPVMVGADGRFVFGFGRDSALTALLVASFPDGNVYRRTLDIADREFRVDRIDGLDQSKVSGFTEEQLVKIRADSALKKAARETTDPAAFWAAGFDWPVTGRISGVFGSQRILNGEPKRPHSGLDVAAPTGTPIRAPAPGVVRLAETDMYFEGGLVLLDHGHWLESAFLHMSRIDVEPGQRIEKGDVIGAVGATGRVTGPHLHWSVKWRGRLVDPRLLVGDMPG